MRDVSEKTERSMEEVVGTIKDMDKDGQIDFLKFVLKDYIKSYWESIIIADKYPVEEKANEEMPDIEVVAISVKPSAETLAEINKIREFRRDCDNRSKQYDCLVSGEQKEKCNHPPCDPSGSYHKEIGEY